MHQTSFERVILSGRPATAVEGSALKFACALHKTCHPEVAAATEGPAVAFSWFRVELRFMPDCPKIQ
jgi:hypothetical protein